MAKKFLSKKMVSQTVGFGLVLKWDWAIFPQIKLWARKVGYRTDETRSRIGGREKEDGK